jgi:hypothetical protein
LDLIASFKDLKAHTRDGFETFLVEKTYTFVNRIIKTIREMKSAGLHDTKPKRCKKKTSKMFMEKRKVENEKMHERLRDMIWMQELEVGCYVQKAYGSCKRENKAYGL